MSAIAHAGSYYAASANDKVERPRLEESIEADVCVIGAGYTGLSAALHLLESGFSVVVLEAARIGWGASGRNGGQIVNSFSRDIDTIEKQSAKNKVNSLAKWLLRAEKSSAIGLLSTTFNAI